VSAIYLNELSPVYLFKSDHAVHQGSGHLSGDEEKEGRQEEVLPPYGMKTGLLCNVAF
jgi:hypothetical protein